MRITFTQSGGFAGLVKGCRIDTLVLAADERVKVETPVARPLVAYLQDHAVPQMPE
jgi:hypothetical protein